MMTHQDPIGRIVANWDPFEEDPSGLCDILEMEAGMTVLAFAGGDASMGFGRVYATGFSPRMGRLLIAWGWTRIFEEERAATMSRGFCIDVPLEVKADHGLRARARGAEVFAETLNQTFGATDGHFFAKPVSLVLVDVRNGGVEGYARRDQADVLKADPLVGWKGRDIVRRLFDRSVAALSADVRGRLPVAYVQREIDRRLKRLDDVRNVAGLDLPRVPTPSIETVRRLLVRHRSEGCPA